MIYNLFTLRNIENAYYFFARNFETLSSSCSSRKIGDYAIVKIMACMTQKHIKKIKESFENTYLNELRAADIERMQDYISKCKLEECQKT